MQHTAIDSGVPKSTKIDLGALLCNYFFRYKTEDILKFCILYLYFRDERTAWWLGRRVQLTATAKRLKVYGVKHRCVNNDKNVVRNERRKFHA